ncbi:MAG: reverse transcriptase domain-containing protein, partial [Fluviibacter sp.]
MVAEISCAGQPHLAGGPGLANLDGSGRCLVEIFNTGPEPISLLRGQVIGQGERLPSHKIRPVEQQWVDSIMTRAQESGRVQDRQKILKESMNLEVPEEYQQRYVDLLLKHHAAFSLNKSDLGLCDLVRHKLVMKTPEPVFVKQFKIPEAHQHYLHEQVKEWLKLGIIQPSRSRYNNPLFLVQKKDGSHRVVQDFRALNAHTYVDKYSMKDVSECISEIGRAGSKIFTTIDLTSGFWQMALDAKSREYTAFTIPGLGQFEWKVLSMGLASAPSGYQRLLELVMKGLDQVLVYIDDIIIHSATHEEHLVTLDQVLGRLARHNLKANLKKCAFGARETSYLGFRLTEHGIIPGADKLKAVKAANPPGNVKQIRQFLGLCNFFRGHIQHFAQLTGPLVALTRKDSTWKKGPLPTEALRAFRHLQSLLCSEPVLAYPRRDRLYSLITDASFGDDKVEGGLGAILTQIDNQGKHYVIAYASRKLQKHEKNYTPFLLEMQAAIFGMETFEVNLKGRHFLLFTDHRPLEKLGKVHTKTLNRLQQMMNVFDFEILYKKGDEMPADFLSRNAVDSIGMDLEKFSKEQNKDELIKSLRLFLLNRSLPANDSLARSIPKIADTCFVQNGVVWKRLDKEHQFRPCLYVPYHLKKSLVADAHGQELTGHFGLLKTKEALLQSYYWPNMDADILEHLKTCQKCQKTRPNRNLPQLLTPLPLPTEPNQRVHA